MAVIRVKDRSYYLMSREFQFGMVKQFWRLIIVMVLLSVNVRNATELHTQKGLKW